MAPILYFARHGQTDWNAEKRLQGQLDVPLNALGRSQATQGGLILRDLFERDGHAAERFDYVSSPLGRARESMELMRAALGLEPSAYSTDPRLMEMSFGRWEGFTYAELQSRETEALAAQQKDRWGFVVPGGESYAQLTERVRAWYETVERDTVVTAHGGVCRALISHFGIEPRESMSMGEVGQGVVYVFTGGTMARYA